MALYYVCRYLPAVCAVGASLSSAVAFPDTRAEPIARLDRATFTGSSDGVVNRFLGIPFGKPPVGPLRFNTPVPVDPYVGSHAATAFGASCPQQAIQLRLPPGLPNATLDFLTVLGNLSGGTPIPPPQSEDCLSLNVYTPARAKPGGKLPVVVWIYGGGFEVGESSAYGGDLIVKRSIELDEPVIYVNMNYRVTAFGFLAGNEVKQAGLGNFGMQDQRLALRWIQKYISAFGGDPSRVTIWGQSAGAISIGLHLVMNNGNTEGLFHGAFMQSGGPLSLGGIESGQDMYDVLVRKIGCTGSADTLECLREADFTVLKQAIDETPNLFDATALRLAWTPLVDGDFLSESPTELVRRGVVAKVPIVIGSCEDDGTLFSFPNINITTDEEFRRYIAGNYLPTVPLAGIDRVLELYPSDPAHGAPFGTGDQYALSPQFKRISAFQGDWMFHAPRRFFLERRAAKQKVWAYLSRRFKTLPVLGATHGTDLSNAYQGGELGDYLIHFVNHLDPNGKAGNTSVAWPRYSTRSPRLLTFEDDSRPGEPVGFTDDTFRAAELRLVRDLALKYPI